MRTKRNRVRKRHAMHVLMMPWAASGLYLLYLISPGALGGNPLQLSPTSDGLLFVGVVVFFLSYTVFLVSLFRDELRELLFHVLHK